MGTIVVFNHDSYFVTDSSYELRDGDYTIDDPEVRQAEMERIIQLHL
jgi:hypothetical protein